MDTSNLPKLVDNPHYHLWTDALHARALSQQASNRWDRGTYVRWAIITAWTALEVACQDALDEPNISYSFKKNLDAALQDKSLPKLKWGEGIWQEVLKLQELRKGYMHKFISEKDLFPDASLSDQAITIIRTAIKEIYLHTGKSSPKWVDDDYDRGWDKGSASFANMIVCQAGVDENDPESLKVTYVYKDREYISNVLAPGTDPEPYVQSVIERTRSPISMIRVYKGSEVILERSLPMRGT